MTDAVEQDIVVRLRNSDGRIAKLLEDAALEILFLREQLKKKEKKSGTVQSDSVR